MINVITSYKKSQGREFNLTSGRIKKALVDIKALKS